MIDFAKLREIAFQELSKFETIRKCSKIPIKNSPPFVDAWEIDSEVEYSGALHNITFILCFPKDFPFFIPKIYLSKKDYEELKYIPHIDTDKFICTYRIDTIILDYTRPEVIVQNCLAQAKKNISDGKNGRSIEDFTDEFLAYWNLCYLHEKEPIKSCLNLIEENLDEICFIKVGKFKQCVGKYDCCIYLDDNVYQRINENLKFIGNEIILINEGLFFPVFPETLKTPPFKLTYGETQSIIKSLGDDALKKFQEYINSWKKLLFVIFKKDINTDKYLIGWSYKVPFQEKINGFRPKKCVPFDQLRMQKKNCTVSRITTETFNSKRLMKRTSGSINYKKFSFSIAGLGSIGSNLVYFLNSYNPDEIRLIDNDKFDVENIYRHLLGLSYAGQYKVNAIRDYLTKKNPKQSIITCTDSVIGILNSKPEFINDTNYFFATTGNENVDNFIGLALSDNIIDLPTFIIWVEPYLVGGHCLFFPKNTSSRYDSLLDGLFFKNNIIDKQNFISKNENLILSEAGCQSCYVPYSGNSVILFLSALFPKIDEIIRSDSRKATGFTWFGDTNILHSKGITISEFAKKYGKFGEIIHYDI